VNSLDVYRRQGEYVLQQDQWKNVSSLTLMSKGEKGVESSSKCFRNRVEPEWPNAEVSLNASVAINAKGGDCWKIQLTDNDSAYTCH
jgi:hypothetical protein